MSEKLWKKIEFIFGLLPLGALFGLIVQVSKLEVKDLDLWLHLAVGRFITLNGFVPSYDVLTNSISGQSWSNHEWLFQVLIYHLHQWGGTDALIQMQTVVVLTTMFVLLFIGYTRERLPLMTFMLLLVFLVFQQRFTIRPDLFSLLFFSLYIFTLSLHIDKKWAVPFLFIVQVLWSNMHGYFFFGPIFVLIGITSEWLKRHAKLPYQWNESGRLSDQEFKRLIFLFAAVLVASLFNPGFIHGACYPIRVFFSLSGENKIFFDYIEELQKPVIFSTLFSDNAHTYYKTLLLISSISFIFNRRKIDISALIFWLIFLIFSLKAMRNTPYFAFAAYLVIVTNLANISLDDILPVQFKSPKFLYITSMFASVLILAWIFQYTGHISQNGYYDFDNYKRKSEFGGVSQRNYPNKAADFLVENNITGNIFNDFNSGAYLLGRTFPNIKVYIDGRTEAFGGAFFNRFRKIWAYGDSKLFEEDERRYGLDIVFLNSTKDSIHEGILTYIYRNPKWKLVYFDYDAMIFLKDIPKFHSLIEKYLIDLEKRKVLSADLKKIGAEQVAPYRYVFRAHTLESLGFDDLALNELEEAVRVSPSYVKAFELMGKIYAKKKDYENAFKYFRLAAVGSPSDVEIRYNLALSYYDLGDYEGASEQYKDIMELSPSMKAAFLLTRSLVLAGKYDDAVDQVMRLKKLDKRAANDLVQLGDLLVEKRQIDSAVSIYNLAYRYEQKNPHLFQMMGQVYQRKGDAARAKKYFEQAAALGHDKAPVVPLNQTH